MILSLLYRAYYVVPERGFNISSKDWFIYYLINLSIGYVVHTVVIIILARRNRFIIDSDYHEIQSNLNAQKVIASSYVAILCKKQFNIEKHLKRSTEIVKFICSCLQKNPYFSNQFSEDYVYRVISASLLHDIGLVSVPEEILTKEGPLTKDEINILNEHPILGQKLIEENMRMVDVEYFEIAKDMSLYHHENYDGSGFPFKLKENGIPFPARIMSVANTIDNLMFGKPEVTVNSVEEVYEELKNRSGKQLDPELVDIILKNKEKLTVLLNSFSE